MRFSPRVHEYLIIRVWAHDDGRLAMAEIWRRVGRDAEKIGLAMPGYHSVRAIVRAERERRAARREALIIALEETVQWAPDGFRILDHLAAATRLHRPGLLLPIHAFTGPTRSSFGAPRAPVRAFRTCATALVLNQHKPRAFARRARASSGRQWGSAR